jgi:hypothetical protein
MSRHLPTSFSRVLLLAVLSLGWGGCSVCGDSEERCISVPLGTRIEALPAAAQEPNTLPPLLIPRLSRGPAAEVGCCYHCTRGAFDCARCGVDCAAPELKAEPFVLGGEYQGPCPSFEFCGQNVCTVWVREGQVVASQSICD